MARDQIATDAFTYSNGNLSAVSGGNWGDLSTGGGFGQVAVAGNVVTTNSPFGASSPAARWIGAGTINEDQYAGVDINLAGWSGSGASYVGGVVLRATADQDGARDYYYAYIEDTFPATSRVVRIGKVINGTDSPLANTTSPAFGGTSGAVRLTFEAETSGSDVILRVFDGTEEVTPVLSYTDNTGTRLFGGQPGIKDGSGVFTLDNWAAGNLTSATSTQEGFRFGLDDGSESAHTWDQDQDTNTTTALAVSRLLRVLIDGTGDLASAAYTLRYQKNGTGGYALVPLVASEIVAPTIEAGDVTESGNNTATTSWAVSYPAYVSGDLLVFHIASDANVTHDWPSTGPNGETINTIVDSTGDTNQRASAFWFVGSATTGASTLTVTPSATEQWTAAVLKVPAGEFNPTTPIQTNTGTATDSTADTAASTPAWTADATAGGRVVVWFAIDTVQATAAPAGWQIVASEDRGALGGTLGIRDAATTASESIASADFTMASETDTSIGYVINGVSTSYPVYVSASANIAAGGEATTARLTAPAGKTTGDFTTGRRWDDENGSDSIDIAADQYTELEWSITVDSPAVDADYFDFRVYAGSTALNTYTVTPRWTVSAASGPVITTTGIQSLNRQFGPQISARLGGVLQ